MFSLRTSQTLFFWLVAFAVEGETAPGKAEESREGGRAVRAVPAGAGHGLVVRGGSGKFSSAAKICFNSLLHF